MSCPCKKAVNIFESASTPYRIGKTGENVYQEIEFNFSKWLSEYPDAKIDLLIRAPKNGYYLLAEGITEPIYIWKPTAFDLANPGRATVMARMSAGEVRAKSDPVSFEIVRAMDYNLDISEPGPTRPSLMDEWIEDIYEAAARYPKIGEEDGYWYVWDVVEGDWKKTDTYAGAYVNSVNGKTGNVTLTAADVGALPESTVIPTVPAMATAADMSDWTSGKTVDAAVLKTDFQYALNTLGGIVDAVDAHASEIRDLQTDKADKTEIPTKTSDLTNDSGFVTAQQAAASAPVQSVNGQTGAVVLNASDVGALPDSTVIPTVPTAEISANTAARHTHSNKALLDTYEQTEVNLADAVAKKHSHSNKSVLDGISANDVSAWNAKYSKPSGGIPASDLAAGVIPTVPQMATQTDMSDWTSGKTVDAAVLKTDFLTAAGQIGYVTDELGNKANRTEIPTKTSDLTNDSNFQTAAQVQTAIENAAELPSVTASDNGKFLRVADGAWTAEAGDEYDAYSALPSDTASGAIASFPDGADDVPVKSLVAKITPVQSGSGDPSPTNIRPISGWTGATVTRTGDNNQSNTYDITFPSEAGTVYGGTLDVTNGVLTVDSAIVDMGTLKWMYYSAQQRMVAQVNSAKPAAANVGLDGACSVYKVVKTGYRLAPDKSIVIGNNFISNMYAAMVVYDSDYTDVATFKTAVSGQTLVFQLKNPITYQLDPVTVTTLLGVNSIWADTGDVAVDYRADTGLYIQKLTGSTEEDMIADAPIASGKYFLVGNTLYLSTAAIAAGAILTPGTNCVKTNLAEALNALNLPAVTASDNGKFLRVVSGAWAAETVQTWQGGSY